MKLSQLLKFDTEHPVIDSSLEKTITSTAAVAELRKSDGSHSSPRRTAASASSIQIPRRMPARDMSSSIASNLASARGIRSTNSRRALSPSVSTQQAPGSLEVPARRNERQSSTAALLEQNHGKPSWVPPMPSHPSKTHPEVETTHTSVVAERTPASASEEGFQRFYSTVESLLSKLSAPLAFAGLPLISEEPSTPPEEANPKDVQQRPRRGSVRPSSAELDLTKFISRAALRASTHPNHGNDSFYVVPTTGGTVSYANILTYEEKEKRRLAASMHSADPDLFDDPDNDDFVDAHETPMPTSPGLKKRLGAPKGKSSGIKELENVVEELYTENKSLKECIDKLSRRLHAFEMSAQSSTLALQESIRLMKPTSSPSPGIRRGSSDGVDWEMKMVARMKALEEQAATQDEEHLKLGKENEKVRTENEKLKAVVLRYRERWEKLKEGAKTRREGVVKDGQGGASGAGKDGQGAS